MHARRIPLILLFVAPFLSAAESSAPLDIKRMRGPRDGIALQWRELKILFHSVDHGESCATLMLPIED